MGKVKVTDEHLNLAIEKLIKKVNKRKEKRKGQPYKNRHHSFGKITEEYYELSDAIRSEDHKDINSESLDVAEACIYAIASSISKKQHKENKK